MSEVLRKQVKSEYNGLVWLHQKYVEAVMNDEATLVIVYKDREMTIRKEDLVEQPPVKGKETYINQWGPEKGRYRLYGFLFEPDQKELFSNT